MDSHIHIYTHICYAASYYTGHRFFRESHILHTHFHAKISTWLVVLMFADYNLYYWIEGID